MDMTKENVSKKYNWDLSDIFASTKAWEDEFSKLNEKAAKIKEYKGSIADSPENLANVLILNQDFSMEIMELYSYARMNKDLDNKNHIYQGMFERISGEYFKIAGELAFIEPEISCMDDEKILEYQRKTNKLDEFSHYLDNLIRNKKHILSEKEERILTGIGPAIEGIEEAYSMMNDVEFDFGKVVTADGKSVKITHGSFGYLRESTDRNVRKQVFKKLHTPYKKFSNTLAAIYTSNVKSDVFFAKTRGFASTLDRAMFADGLETEIYTNLIESIHSRLPSYHRYLMLRKKYLKLEENHIYDTAVPLTSDSATTKTYSYDEALTIMNEGLKPLGKKYLEDMQSLFKGGAIDVYEKPGKTSGAYAWGTYGSHPYMLLNWSGKLNDVFTLAHETGHCMHSYYSKKEQSFINSQYPIFLAEIASTVNENVLLKYLLSKTDENDREGLLKKTELVNHFLDGVKSTVIRQTMFAEFEMKIHKMAEDGMPLNAKSISEVYGDLLTLYFGKDVVVDEYMKWEWARIPHFYRAFYVYKYATGFCAAAMISDMLMKGEDAQEKYTRFLSEGGSDYPHDILKRLGVDLTGKGAVESTMDQFDEAVTQLERLLGLLE